jgi:hypothetical protein
MRAGTPKSQGRNSHPTVDAYPVETYLIDGDRPSAPLCPLKKAIRDELHALGVGVSEVHRYLHCGDLGNAEEMLGSIFSRLQQSFCSPEPSQCDWVRERGNGTDCDLLTSHKPLYSQSIPKPATQPFGKYSQARSGSDQSSVCDQSSSSQKAEYTSSLFNDLLDQAMRF